MSEIKACPWETLAVHAIIKDFCGRCGCEGFWRGIHNADRDEIRQTWAEIIRNHRPAEDALRARLERAVEILEQPDYTRPEEMVRRLREVLAAEGKGGA